MTAMTDVFINNSYKANHDYALAFQHQLQARAEAHTPPVRIAILNDREKDDREQLEQHLDSWDILIPILSSDWFEAARKYATRRFAVREALRVNAQVIPVLVHSAAMPTAADLPGDIQRLAELRPRTIVNGTEAAAKADIDDIVNEVALSLEARHAIRNLLNANEGDLHLLMDVNRFHTALYARIMQHTPSPTYAQAVGAPDSPEEIAETLSRVRDKLPATAAKVLNLSDSLVARYVKNNAFADAKQYIYQVTGYIKGLVRSAPEPSEAVAAQLAKLT